MIQITLKDGNVVMVMSPDVSTDLLATLGKATTSWEIYDRLYDFHEAYGLKVNQKGEKVKKD